MTRRHFLKLAAMAGVAAAVGLPACRADHAAGVGGGEGAAGDAAHVQRSFFCLDTLCAVGGVVSSSLLDDAVQRCRFFEQRLSATIASSDVGRINSAGGMPVEVEPETADLIGRSLRYSRESDGLFDITIGAVSALWDFKRGVVPSAYEIAKALPHVDYRGVRVEGREVTLLDSEARIDLGGIAKGFIADDIIARLAAAGAESAFVNLGGNVKVLGSRADGLPWSIGVRDPWDPSSVAATIESTGGSLVTSGLYERRFERDGRGYWHILDPRTGYPAETGIVSASVYSADSIDGDGFTKPLFLMDEEDALAFLQSRPVLQGLLIRADGSRVVTPGAAFVLR